MTITHRTPAPFGRLASAILTLAALLVAMAVTASPASAHARLEASSPKDGSTLTATPPEVMLRFNEPIKDSLNQISVKSGSTDATDGKLEVDGNTVYQPLKSSLAAGDYTATYKVISADGHPISGTLKFTYTPPAGDEGAVDPPTSTTSGSTGSPTSSASPTSSGSSTTAPSASSTDSATSPTPSSTTAPTGSSSSPSSSTSATDGETQPTAPDSTSSSSSSTAAAPTEGDEGSSDGGVPTWVWIAGLGVLLVLLAAAGLIARGRGEADADEDIDLDEWRG